MNKTRYSDRYFEGADLSDQAGRRAVRGVAVTLSSQSVKFVLQFGSIIILARLLTPEDFGLVAMVSVFVNFLNMFKDFGLSQAVIQSKEIKRGEVSSLFWINIGICLCISLSMLVVAPGVAEFYGREELVYVTILLGSGIALQSVGLQHRALLIRTMQFVKVEVVELVAMFGALGVAISLATAGYTYWALVWQAVSQALILSLGYIIACRWLPGKFSSFRECLHLFRFGGGVFSSNLVNYFSRNTDNILIGRFIGANSLGLYSKAYQLLMLPMQQVTGPVTKVALPLLSRLQNDAIEFRRNYLRFLTLVTVINVPIIIYLGVFADIVVETVLGAQWLGMVDVFRCLVPAALMGATNVAVGWVLMPLGRVSKNFYLGLFSSVVFVISIVIGLNWGLLGVACAVSISRLVLKLPILSLAYRKTEIRLTDFVRIQLWPILASGGGSLIMVFIMDHYSIRFEAFFSFLGFTCIYLVLLLLDSRFREDLLSLKKCI